MKSVDSHHFWLVIFVFVSQISLLAASSVGVITDRVTYVTNEVLYGAVIIEGVNVDNRVLKASLVDAKTFKKVYNCNMRIYEGRAIFYMPILPSFKSGSYIIQIEACHIKNTNRSLVDVGSVLVHLLNIDDNSLGRTAFVEMDRTDEWISEDANVNITASIRSSDKLFVDINSTSSGSYLVTAGDEDNKMGYFIKETNWNQAFVDEWSTNNFAVLPVIDASGMRQHLVGLYSPSAAKTYTSRSDAKGIAIFILEEFEGYHDFVLLSYLNKTVVHNEDYKFIIDLNSTDLNDKGWDDILTAFEEGKKRAQIHVYFGVETFGVEKPLLLSKNSFPKSQGDYIIANYKKFPDLASFFKENLIPLRFTTDKKGLTKAVLTPPLAFSNGVDTRWENPLFLIDGVPNFDFKSIETMSLDNIRELSVYLDLNEINPWMSIFGHNGVINIKSTNPIEQKAKYIPVRGVQNALISTDNLLKKAIREGNPLLNPTTIWRMESKPISLEIVKNNSNVNQKISVYRVEGNVIRFKQFVEHGSH